MPHEATYFLNVDLELVTGGEIGPLLAEWGALVMLRDSVDDGKRTIWIELEEEYIDVDSTLRGFLDLVESLPAPLRKLWDECDDRCFNVGVQAGATPNSVAIGISSNTLRRIAVVDAHAVFTVYGAPREAHDQNR